MNLNFLLYFSIFVTVEIYHVMKHLFFFFLGKTKSLDDEDSPLNKKYYT